jgi:uracil-DNA glycosylase family 4
MEPVRRRVLSKRQELIRANQREIDRLIGRDGMYPLNAPGMPLPGPNFLRQADAEPGATDTTIKKTKDGVSFTPGEVLDELYRRALREPGFTLPISVRGGAAKAATFVPGHVWGEFMDEYHRSMSDWGVVVPPVTGPQPADVMVIGKMPWKEETQEGRNFVGGTGRQLLDVCAKVHIKGCHRWYITNVLKFMPPDGSTDAKKYLKDCLPLLHQELRIVRPRYILCLGADASTALLGKQFNVSYMDGRVVPVTYPIHISHDREPQYHTAQVVTVVHPAQVLRAGADMERVLEKGMARFGLLVSGADFANEEEGLDHRLCDSYEDAVALVREAEEYMKGRPRADRAVAVDAEWEGQHPVNPGSYVRTVQLSWREKQAVCFKLRHAGGEVAFRDKDGKPALKRLMRLLTNFMKGKRAVGHFLVADLEWLQHEGFDLLPAFRVPLFDAGGKKAWQRCMLGEGGADTAMMAHAVEETAMLGLEHLSMRYTTAPRYDIPLHDWRVKRAAELKTEAKALEGYGECPDEILVPYACYDSDVTLRLFFALRPLLDHDYYGQCAWEAFWESMVIQPTILEIHQNGIKVDKKRVDTLTMHFLTARGHVEDLIVQDAKWDDVTWVPKGKKGQMKEVKNRFNIRSVQHVKEYLFGESLNGKLTKDGKTVRLRPAGARSLGVAPLLDTSKPPQRWTDLVAKGKEQEHSPGTGKMILAILAQDNPHVATEINRIRDYRFLDQVLKSVLRKPRELKPGEEPERDPADGVVLPDSPETADGGLIGSFVEDENGDLVYDAGLPASIDWDGAVRTHLYPTAETARWKSARPNLQNISKQRDADYTRLLGKENYKHKLRSLLRAPRKGELLYNALTGKFEAATEDYVLIEADYKGAELYGMAIMAGDPLMIEHAQRNQLDDGETPGRPKHPDFYDIHSNVAVMAFRLSCEPTKHGLQSIGKAHLRTIAKNVIFGIAYGRQAKAIALSAREQGVTVSVEDAQQVIDTIFKMYPKLVPFFAACSQRALNEQWLCHCFGRMRRFRSADDYKLEGEFER